MSLFDVPAPVPDSGVEAVASAVREIDPTGSKLESVFRETFDQLYDGQRTGRYSVEQLFKTEKTHFGTLVEINFQRAFEVADGDVLDFKIAGIEVDCKFSHTGAWMLPVESFDHVALVLKADDRRSRWSAGVVRVSAENRRTSENRDRKTGLNARGRSQVLWIYHDSEMRPNALLEIEPSVVAKIMSERSGQARLNSLFRSATNRRLTRNIIATVAQQDDYMKRVRDNGGSRGHLRPEGFIILSGDYSFQRRVALELGATVPDPGEVVSLRVVRSPAGSGVEIDGGFWRLADPSEIASESAPVIRR